MNLEIQPDKPGNGHHPKYVRFPFGDGSLDMLVGPFKPEKAKNIAKKVWGSVFRERLFKKGSEFFIKIEPDDRRTE